jgi:tRNA pseudouridine65 synthase
VVDHPIRDHDGTPKDAITHVTPIAFAATPRVSLVAASIRTGRKHQIRRHLKHLSHPVIGDANYGKGPVNRELAATHGITRLALHAWQLDVAPEVGDPLASTSPLPDDLQAPLRAMFNDSECFDQLRRAALLGS